MNPKLFNEDYLKHLCQKYGLVPSKKYGQNFLINPEPIEKMVEAAGITADDTVVEVGPGLGVLTFALAAAAKKVLTFEIEKKLAPYWEEQIQNYKNVEIIWGNVLMSLRGAESDEAIPSVGSTTIQWDRHASLAMTNPYKVVANLPYQITSNVIRTFLEMENPPEVLVLMVQKEVAERICAKPGDMSVLSVSVQYYGEPEIVVYVPRANFWPAPAVDSAVIRIRIKNREVRIKEISERFFSLVKAGFASRRKMLIKNLGSITDKNKLRDIFKELQIDEKVRAQELSVEQWEMLVHKVLKVESLPTGQAGP